MSPTLTGEPALSGADMVRGQNSLRLMSCRVAVRISGVSGVICMSQHDNSGHTADGHQFYRYIEYIYGFSPLQIFDIGYLISALLLVS